MSLASALNLLKGFTGQSKEENPYSGWGTKTTTLAATKVDNYKRFGVNFPYGNSQEASTGKIGINKDGSIVIVDGQLHRVSPAVNSLDGIFPAYFTQVNNILEDCGALGCDGAQFTINKKSTVNIGSYQMSECEGTCELEKGTQNTTLHFKAYGTRLKSNNAVGYCMAIGEADVVNDLVLKMANTFSEE